MAAGISMRGIFILGAEMRTSFRLKTFEVSGTCLRLSLRKAKTQPDDKINNIRIVFLMIKS
jgi:hypothetical protein